MIPGKVLEPGRYLMKLADSASNRHIVQVFNDDTNEVQATILAIPNYRMQPRDGTTLLYHETRGGAPRALKAWFYPGDLYGQEFAYPEDVAQQLAAQTGETVPAIAGDGSDQRRAEVREAQPDTAADASQQAAALSAGAQPCPCSSAANSQTSAVCPE
jgi:hypothetical protein